MNGFNITGYCQQCGKPLIYKTVGDEGEQKYCPDCNRFYFDNPACCVLAAIINKKNQVLLLKQNYISEDKYTLCSGYSKYEETLEETVHREVLEETGYSAYKIEYIDSYYYCPKDIVMPGFIVYAEESPIIYPKSKEVDEMLWVDLERAEDMVLRVNNLSGVHLDKVIEKLTGKHITAGVVRSEYFFADMDSHGRYSVYFDDDRMIYDMSDVYDFNKAAERVIKPEEVYDGGYTFTKDNIKVSGYWDDCFGYFWEAIAKTEEEEKKIIEWAAAASDEFMKLNERLRPMIDDNLFLAIPDKSHRKAYTKMISRWEKFEEKINPSLLGRYSDNKKRSLTYDEWLACCEDDRTTGSMLSTGVPRTLYFLMNGSGEILGGIEINHANTHRGHIHMGIAPWNRRRGFGKIMLKLALEKCREMGSDKAEICTRKDNIAAIKTILGSGGVLTEEFFEDGIWSCRYSIEL